MTESNWLSASASSSSPAYNTETGILRTSKQHHHQQQLQQMQNTNDNRFDDLLIFGYACKLFRDDEKARYIDQGKHLIPWMGDNTLKIDRYDVRAALTDIGQYEAPAGGYDNRLDYLSSAEQRAEQLCEHERYFSLYNNDVEEELYKEEELKRLKLKVGSAGYGQVGFNYDQTTSKNDNSGDQPSDNINDETKTENDKEEPDEVYVPNPKFIIPADIELPETTKVHAIIEKTAKFISSQGMQMEILIKAKQANNPLFEFLNQSSRLNRFYKHTLQTMINGAYPEESARSVAEKPIGSDEATTSNSILDYYKSMENHPKIHVPTIKYKPSVDCAYTQLISKIKGVPISTEIEAYNRENTPSPNSLSGFPDTDQSMQGVQQVKNKVALTKPKTDVEVKKISTGLMLAQYYNSDSDSENDAGQDSNSNPSLKPTINENDDSQSSQPLTSQDDTPIPEGILCPPTELRTIIDKTAAYVLKNGKEFEHILRTKSDQRFSFLQYTDQYHKYYIYKVTGVVCINPVPSNPSNADGKKILNEANAKSINNRIAHKVESNTSKLMTPVSFSIKPKDEIPIALPVKPALSLEQSSDEDEQSNDKKDGKNLKDLTLTSTKTHTQYQQPNVSFGSILQQPLRIHQNYNAAVPNARETYKNGNLRKNHENSFSSDVDQSDSFLRDTMLEQQNLEGKKEAKRAEDKVKNRLAQIAREKLGILSKEKQLQLERKKRAMAFLNQINGPATESSDSTSKLITSNPLTSNSKQIDDASTNSDSSESVTFVTASPSISSMPTLKRQRNLRTTKIDDEDDDVIEIVTAKKLHSRSRSRLRSHSRTRSKSSSAKQKKSKHSKKKTSKRRSRSRSHSRATSRSRSHYSSRDHKRSKRSSSNSRRRNRGYSDE